MEIDDDRMTVINEEGEEIETRILLTFESTDYNKNYVLFCREDNEDEIIAASYDEEGNLFLIEDPAELDMAQEVWEAFESRETEDGEDQEDQETTTE